MADILKTSPALVAAAPSANRPDETRGRDASDSETGTAAPVTFAALLKSRSDRNANADAAKGSTVTDADGAKFEVSAADAAALLSSLGAMPAADFIAGDASSAVAGKASADSRAGSEPGSPAELASLGLASSDLFAEKAENPATMPAAAVAQDPGAIPIALATPLPGAVSVSPAPTSGKVANARDAKAADLAWQGTRPPDPPTDRPALADKLAAGPAISAETAISGSRTAGSGENATDFRSMLDRVAGHTGNPAMHAGGTSQTNPAPPVLKVDTGFGQAGWAQEMGDRLSWMAGNGRQQADLVLNPPQLGRIEVSMVIEGDNVSATFASANAMVREVLENSMSRLREVMADAGVTLGDTHVGAECRHDGDPATAKRDRSASGHRFDEAPAAANAIVGSSGWHIASGRGMVDVFA